MIYAQEKEHIVYFSFKQIFDDDYFSTYTVKESLALIYSFLNTKKEVIILRDKIEEPIFSKGRHHQMSESYIYLNPSIRKKFLQEVSTNSHLDYLSLYKVIQEILST